MDRNKTTDSVAHISSNKTNMLIKSRKFMDLICLLFVAVRSELFYWIEIIEYINLLAWPVK